MYAINRQKYCKIDREREKCSTHKAQSIESEVADDLSKKIFDCSVFFL